MMRRGNTHVWFSAAPRRAGRGLIVALWSGLLVGGLAACADQESGTGPDPAAIDRPDLTVAPAVGDTEFFDITVDLGVAFCSTAVGCPPELHGAIKPSLVTGATCSMPDPWDGFLLYARRLTCYSGFTGGSLTADPATWLGPTTVSDPAAATEERAYSAVFTANHTEYVNSTQYLAPLGTGAPSHCAYEGEALVVPTAMDAAPRAVYHRQNPARMIWGVVIEPDAGAVGGFDCHFGGSPVLSGLDVDYPASVTVSLPSAPAKGTYPATFDYATVRPVTLNAGAAFGAARIRYVLGATMPATPLGLPTWAERDLWVQDGANPLDAAIDSTCVRLDGATGALVSIGILLRDASDDGLVGAIEVLADESGTRFDCPRELDGSCSVVPYLAEPGGEAVCAEVIARCHDGVQNNGEVAIDCGGSCAACGAGTSCSADGDCLSGYCDAAVCVAPTSCLALYTARPGTPSGRYQLDPDGVGGAAPLLAYCDMASGDPGWTLVMRLSTNTQNLTHAAPAWTTTALMNGASPQPNLSLATATDAKYAAYNTVAGTALRLDWLAPTGVSWTYPLEPGEVTALDVFSGPEHLIVGDEGIGQCNASYPLTGSVNYAGDLMHFGSGSQFYGFNGADPRSSESRIRWGFGSNALRHPTVEEHVATWRPQVGIGSPTGSIFWTYQSICDPCACFGTGSAAYPSLAGNLWIK